jgi:3D-(3,5/4)-trihydroxycyclohexane-1,2-dione acylhydrolase (decyclizing)
MNKTIRLTTAQATVRYLAAQRIELDDTVQPLFAGVFAIFGHGNVAGLGEALATADPPIPVYRAHNEQAMAHAAIAFAKAKGRRQMMACTTSIGPGATNMVTAAALAHVNRLPVLFLPGDVFASRRPDPVLQQIENFSETQVTVNDTFRPVSRFWDRILRPEQILASLPQALSVLLDPAECGPAVIAMPQDVQAEAWDFPVDFFTERLRTIRRPPPDRDAIARTAALLDAAERPLIIAGGGVHYSGAPDVLDKFLQRHGIPVAETQAGKGSLPWNHPCNLGAIGVTGSTAANRAAREADLILALGTRLQDFTTASHSLFNPDAKLVAINVARFDCIKAGALAVQADAAVALDELERLCRSPEAAAGWQRDNAAAVADWQRDVDSATAPGGDGLPSDAQVLGAVNRTATDTSTVVCAAGGLPGELHKLWRASGPGAYHLEYGYSCMGYEIAGGLGVKMAQPEREVLVLVGDGSYLMMNSEIATSIMLGCKLTIVILDNRGFGCIERLQAACGGESFNNLLSSEPLAPAIDFVAHAAALGALAVKADNLEELQRAIIAAREADRTSVVVIDTDARKSTSAGGAWWDVPVAEVSSRESVRDAYADYRQARDT